MISETAQLMIEWATALSCVSCSMVTAAICAAMTAAMIMGKHMENKE